MADLLAPSGSRLALRRALVYLGPVAAYAGIIFLLSAQSSLPSPHLSHIDKVEHFVAYGVLGALVARALRGYGRTGAGAVLIATVCSALYGATDEVHQYFVPGRSPDVYDWITDALGAAAGAFLWFALKRLARPRLGKEAP